jgi:hypothetical protein
MNGVIYTVSDVEAPSFSIGATNAHPSPHKTTRIFKHVTPATRGRAANPTIAASLTTHATSTPSHTDAAVLVHPA